MQPTKTQSKECMASRSQETYDPTVYAYRNIGRSYLEAVIRKLLIHSTGDSSSFCVIASKLPQAYNQQFYGWISHQNSSPYEEFLSHVGYQFTHGNF